MNESVAIPDAPAPTVAARPNEAPISFEADAVRLPVTGELPAELNGTLYRIGPNPQFVQAGAHWFGGDGMLHAFRLESGCASYRNRWVRTAHFKAERAAGRRLFGSFGQPDEDADAAADVPDEGAANTHIVWHAGRLLVLEEAHRPIEIEPGTLATRGPFDFGGALPEGPFTAHPKTDPATGELLFFGYGASGPLSAGMTFGTADMDGRITRLDRFDAPFASMVHDFAVTARHVLFPVLPLTASRARAERGLPPFAWEPQLGSRVGVLRRGGDVADIRWFEGEPGFVFHVMNAWEEQDERGHLRILADVMRYDEPPLFPHPDGSPTDPVRSVARLCRWTFDLDRASNRFTQTPLDDLIGEFPRIDERRAGLPYRHGWYECRLPGDGSGPARDGLAHHDAASGQRTQHWLPPGDRVSEPVFVPRSAEAAEGDGWLLATVYRAAECRSDLAVFDALSLADGPVATVQLAHRVPAGFHGNWLPARY